MSQYDKFEALKRLVADYEKYNWERCLYADSFEEWIEKFFYTPPSSGPYKPYELKLRVWYVNTYPKAP